MNRILVILALVLLAGCQPHRKSLDSTESVALPRRSAYSNKTDFLRARVEYYATQWIRENPDKPWHYTPAVPIVEVTNGVWGMETGPAVVSGAGLFITVDDSGDLIGIKEIFNPD